MMVKSLRAINHFVAAVKCGSLHKAAVAQGVTQSAISKSLQNLEAELGGELVDRSSRGVTLTKFGEVFFNHALRIQNECNSTMRSMGDIASGQAGTLTIAAGSAWISVFVPQVIAKLHVERPRANFIVLSSAGARFSEQFANDVIDVGLGSIDSIPMISDEFAYEPISFIRTHFLARADHPLHQKGRVTLEDLLQYPWSMPRRDQEMSRQIERYFRSAGLIWPTPSLSADSLTTVLETVRLTSMITSMPSPILGLAATMGVVPLPFEESPWSFRSGIVYRKSSSNHPLLAYTIDVLHEMFDTPD